MAAPGVPGKDEAMSYEAGIPRTLKESDVANFNLIMDHVIGVKKTPNPNILSAVTGVPQMPSTKEELFIRDLFDSCAFKSTMSGVVGKFVVFVEAY